MSQKEKVKAEETQRTTIEDISAIGHELSMEHLELTSGGFGALFLGGYGASGSAPMCTGPAGACDDISN